MAFAPLKHVLSCSLAFFLLASSVISTDSPGVENLSGSGSFSDDNTLAPFHEPGSRTITDGSSARSYDSDLLQSQEQMTAQNVPGDLNGDVPPSCKADPALYGANYVGPRPPLARTLRECQKLCTDWVGRHHPSIDSSTHFLQETILFHLSTKPRSFKLRFLCTWSAYTGRNIIVPSPR